MPWWVLNVFCDLIELEKFSEAKIFTIFSDREYLETKNWKIEVVTALPKWINNIFLKFSNKKWFLAKILDYRNLMFFYKPLMKILSKKITNYKSPKVVISSFAIAKNLEFCKKDYNWDFRPITYLYLHSPMQYIRSHNEEYIQKLKWFKLKIFKYITPKLRVWDQKYVNYDKVYTNSKYTSNLAKQIYDIDSNVDYPKIDETFLNSNINLEPNSYYIYVWRLVRFVKEVDKIIKLFNEINEPLLIMWSWPDEKYLKSIAKWNIIFIWRIKDPKEKAKIIKNAKWMINITKESFGIVTVESLLLWVPVFAYNDWASPELVDNNSWILVPNKKHDTLLEYFQKFSKRDRDRSFIKKDILEKIKKA